jgi:hypothetical protein
MKNRSKDTNKTNTTILGGHIICTIRPEYLVFHRNETGVYPL